MTPTTKLEKLSALLSQSGDSDQETEAVFADLLSVPAGERYPPLPDDPRQKRERISWRSSDSWKVWRSIALCCSCSRMRTGAIDLTRSAGSGRRARPSAAGSYGCDIPSRVRAALDRPSGGDLPDIEPSRQRETKAWWRA